MSEDQDKLHLLIQALQSLGSMGTGPLSSVNPDDGKQEDEGAIGGGSAEAFTGVVAASTTHEGGTSDATETVGGGSVLSSKK
jgi:hypothetical protein